MCITIHNLSYIHPDGEPLFRNVSLSVPAGEKAALIGDNGTGKSTLLRIVAGELPPVSGEITLPGKPYFVPQHFGQYDGMSVAEALGIADKIAALHAILAGSTDEKNYTRLGDDWEIEERTQTALRTWRLPQNSLARKMSELSGGEKTKVFLAGIAVHTPALILMDEPSNHLDAAAREQLYELIRKQRATILIVSHDRALLDRLGTLYELTAEGTTKYGGNYEFYKEQKEIRLGVLEERLGEKEKEIRQARRTAREAAERRQRLDARGEKKAQREGVPRILMNTLKNRAENSTARLRDVQSEKIEAIAEETRRIRQELPDNRFLKIAFEDSALHRGKILIEASGLNFAYGETPLWETPLTFLIRSGERIAVRGGNGTGKTTLTELILGNLQPTAGTLKRADFRYVYIDQEYGIVDNRLTVYEQVCRFNRRLLPEHELKTELHRFLFPAASWDKSCSELSGGEKMKLIFCCLLIADDTPDLFVLDEPTNNLDIRSLRIVTSALKAYRGTVLVISHDSYFVREIGTGKEIVLG